MNKNLQIKIEYNCQFIRETGGACFLLPGKDGQSAKPDETGAKFFRTAIDKRRKIW